MKRCAIPLALAVVTALIAASTASAQAIIPIRLDDPAAAREKPKTPAQITREKLARKGIIDGAQWSISLNLSGTPLGTALDFVAEAARAKPREITVIIDREGITQAGLLPQEGPIDLVAKDVSIEEALKMLVSGDLAYEVQEDGSVLVSTRERLYTNLPVRSYDISNVLDALCRRQQRSEAASGDIEVDTYDAQDFIRTLLEHSVRGGESWESMGGRATLDIYGLSQVLVISATNEMHEKVVDALKSILVVDRQRTADLRRRVVEIEKRLADFQAERDALHAAARKLYVEAGRADLSPEVILRDARRLRQEVDELRTRLAAEKSQLQPLGNPPPDAGAEEVRSLTQRIAMNTVTLETAEAKLAEFNTARLLEIGDEIARLKERDAGLIRRMGILQDTIVQYEMLIEAPPTGRIRGVFGPSVPQMGRDISNDARDDRSGR